MKAILKKEEYDALDEALKKLYKADGDRFVLQVEGLSEHPDTQSLRSALQTERTTRETREREMRELKDKIGDLDPEEARKAQARLRELEDQAALGTIPKELQPQFEEAVNKRVAQMERDFKAKETAYQKQITAKDEELKKTTGQLSAVTIEDEVRREGVKMGLHDWAIDDAVLRATQVYKLKDGKPVPEKDGQVIYGKKPQEPMPISEFLGDLVTTRPGWVRESAGSGAQNNGGRTGGGGGNGSVYIIPRADASDPAKYEAHKEAAKKAGQQYQIAPA